MIDTCKTKPRYGINLSQGFQDIVSNFGAGNTLAMGTAYPRNNFASGHAQLIVGQFQIGTCFRHAISDLFGVEGLSRPISFQDNQIGMFHPFTSGEPLPTVVTGTPTTNGRSAVMGPRIDHPIRRAIAVRAAHLYTFSPPMGGGFPQRNTAYSQVVHRFLAKLPDLSTVRQIWREEIHNKKFLGQTVQRLHVDNPTVNHNILWLGQHSSLDVV